MPCDRNRREIAIKQLMRKRSKKGSHNDTTCPVDKPFLLLILISILNGLESGIHRQPYANGTAAGNKDSDISIAILFNRVKNPKATRKQNFLLIEDNIHQQEIVSCPEGNLHYSNKVGIFDHSTKQTIRKILPTRNNIKQNLLNQIIITSITQLSFINHPNPSSKSYSTISLTTRWRYHLNSPCCTKYDVGTKW